MVLFTCFIFSNLCRSASSNLCIENVRALQDVEMEQNNVDRPFGLPQTAQVEAVVEAVAQPSFSAAASGHQQRLCFHCRSNLGSAAAAHPVRHQVVCTKYAAQKGASLENALPQKGGTWPRTP